MIHHALLVDAGRTIAMALAGVALGRAYFAALAWSTRLVVQGGGWRAPVALALGRLAAAGAVFLAAAHLGAAPLLAAFAGFLLARTMALHAARGGG